MNRNMSQCVYNFQKGLYLMRLFVASPIILDDYASIKEDFNDKYKTISK